LDRVCDKVAAMWGKSGPLEYINDVVPVIVLALITTEMCQEVHHEVHPRELRPHLKGSAEGDTMQDARFE
jgi:hypothetical protein